MRSIGLAKIACMIAAVFCVATAVALHAQTYTLLSTFNGTNGDDPFGVFAQGTDGNFYGATAYGGVSGNSCPFEYSCGVIYNITPAGQMTTIYNFCHETNCTDGTGPNGGLLLAPNGNFYGTTAFGGTSKYCVQVFPSGYGCGTIFEITASGGLKTLYNFCSEANCADGAIPNGSLVLGANGSLYGTAQAGGASCANAADGNGCGTVFEVTPAGKLTTLHSFCSHKNLNGVCTDGNNPIGGVVLAANGNFYGTTTWGGFGITDVGTIFELTPGGKLTSLHRFCSEAHCADGRLPWAGLVQATNGNFYGTTAGGGGLINDGGGTVFEVTAAGKLTTLYEFCSQTNCTDGYLPVDALVQATDGNFYGTASNGGTNSGCGSPGCGTIFSITSVGNFSTVYDFCSQPGCTDGAGANTGLMQGTDGILYGTSGTTVYSLSVGLGPFVAANPNFGVAGRVVIVLGNNLTGTTSVTFNGTPATFTVGSGGTYLKATVPAGATTGTIVVTTPSGTLNSNVAFRVLQ